MLTLYHAWDSTCSQKVRLCLAEKELDYEGVVLNLRRFEHLTDPFLEMNPAGYVPVLRHNGFMVTESTIINDYLEDAFPDVRLRPADPAGRAVVASWNRWVDDVTSPAIKLPSFQKNVGPGAATLAAEQVAAALARIPNRLTALNWRQAIQGTLDADRLAHAHSDLRQTLDRMERALAVGPWLAGRAYSLADVNMAPFVHRLTSFPEYPVSNRWPRVADWYERLRARPAYARARILQQGLSVDASPV